MQPIYVPAMKSAFELYHWVNSIITHQITFHCISQWSLERNNVFDLLLLSRRRIDPILNEEFDCKPVLQTGHVSDVRVKIQTGGFYTITQHFPIQASLKL